MDATPSKPAFRIILAASCLALLGACGTQRPGHLRIDRSIQAKSQSSRVEFVVLHYTSAGNAAALRILSTGKVSSHYLVSRESPPRIYQLVDENRRAWHAGISQWYGHAGVNAASIGVEIVNGGGRDDVWESYPPEQMAAVKALVHDIVRRHGIQPRNIVGHSDVAPQRKVDPGPLFPWAELAREGLGRWYDEAQVAINIAALQRSGVPDTAWFQRELTRLGYSVPLTGVLDGATLNVMRAFQMHYRPSRHDGQPDLETAAILQALQ